MSGPGESWLEVGGHRCRVWEKGEGEPIGFFAGLGGLQKWSPFLEQLAATHRVIVPSLPGFPGADRWHDDLDTHLEWLLATRDILDGAGLRGCDIIAASVAGALVADVAALWPELIRRLILVAPLGMFDAADPITDIWAQRAGEAAKLLCENAENYAASTDCPEDADLAEWQIIAIRANEAGVRILWPLSDTGLIERLARITNDVLVVWGESDRIVSPRYAERFAAEISGSTTIKTIAGAGHLVDIDAPEALVQTLEAYLAQG